jgi:two-component system chemotaxis response regulator CheB
MAARPRDVVVVGASAGGVEALRAMVAGFPADLPVSVLVVLHMPTGGTSALPAILSRSGPLPASPAQNGELLEHRRVYVGRPNHHLLVINGAIALSHGPTENGHRPAINALFRSAAVTHGAAVTGVLLSGVLDDGVAGLLAIAGRGGCVVVQNPADALYPGMPEKALRSLTPDHVAPATEIGQVLAKITEEHTDNPGNEGTSELLHWRMPSPTPGRSWKEPKPWVRHPVSPAWTARGCWPTSTA